MAAREMGLYDYFHARRTAAARRGAANKTLHALRIGVDARFPAMQRQRHFTSLHAQDGRVR